MFRKLKTILSPSIIVWLVVFVLIMAFMSSGILNASEGGSSERRRITEDNIRRAAITCYSLEGCYPASIKYLEDNYSVYIDYNVYNVYYSIFAPNIMPEISVIIK